MYKILIRLSLSSIFPLYVKILLIRKFAKIKPVLTNGYFVPVPIPPLSPPSQTCQIKPITKNNNVDRLCLSQARHVQYFPFDKTPFSV